MQKKDVLTRVLSLAGAALAWFPILLMVLIAVFALIARGIFMMDPLMLMELFPFALIGGALLLWAALRARTRRGLIGWSLGIAIVALIGTQVLAVVTGLASGGTEPAGWAWAVVIAALVLYILAILALDVSGILLTRDVFGRRG